MAASQTRSSRLPLPVDGMKGMVWVLFPGEVVGHALYFVAATWLLGQGLVAPPTALDHGHPWPPLPKPTMAGTDGYRPTCRDRRRIACEQWRITRDIIYLPIPMGDWRVPPPSCSERWRDKRHKNGGQAGRRQSMTHDWR